MKKLALGFTVLAVLAVGFFFIPGVAAEEGTPPVFPMGHRGRFNAINGETGPLHDLTIEKIAEKTGLSLEETTTFMEERILHEALLDLGYTDEDIADLMKEIHEEVFAQAQEEGWIPEGLGQSFGSGMKGPGMRGKFSGFRTFGENSEVPPMHEYHSAALAEGLGITVDELVAYHEDGLTLLEIRDELGFTAEEVSEIFKAARQAAFDKAVEEGLIPENAGQIRPDGGTRGPGNFGPSRGDRGGCMFGQDN